MIRTKLDTEELRIVLETMLRLRERIRDNVVSVGLCGELAVLLPGGVPIDDLRELLFGPKAAAKDLMSTEQLINMIKKYKTKDAPAIFKDAVKGIKRLKFPVPKEITQYDV